MMLADDRHYLRTAWLWIFAFGMLSKYTMVIFLPGAYLFGLLWAPYRSRLATFPPYAAVLLGLFMFLPVIFWPPKSGV